MLGNATVHIVHHVDTEGPLYEDISATFNRIESILDIKIDLEHTKENLERLKTGFISEQSARIARLAEFKGSWNAVEEMLGRILLPEFRNKISDSFGSGWVYNWHIMDHAGFIANPRKRDLGYLKVFERYEKLLEISNSKQDEMHWHFHPVSLFKEAHSCGTCYENSYDEIHQIITRRLIEKNWFPVVNRPGFHTERPDSNFFLEQYIPFDAANQSLYNTNNKTEISQTDNRYGRFGDWEGAPSDWSLYHPDLYDWRKSGNLNRVISRVLNMNSRFRNIDKDEIIKAFEKAQNENIHVYLGITNHDFREMSDEINEFRELLIKVAKKYPKVNFKFNGALDAFRKALGYKEKEIKENAINFDIKWIESNVLKVEILNGEPFGPQPYLALKTKNKKYLHDNFDFGKFKKEYFYTFDNHTVYLKDLESLAVASNDKYGNTCIKRINF